MSIRSNHIGGSWHPWFCAMAMLEGEKEMRTLREQIEGRCIHFNGIQHDKCEAAMIYKDIGNPMPCLKHLESPHNCPKLQWPTNEQVNAEIAEIEKECSKMEKIGPTIKQVKREHKGESWRGTFDCLACGGKQTLHIGISSYNGHTRGQCETKDCVGWIE